MVSEFFLDGFELKKSEKSGKEYAVLYVKEIRNGEPSIKQSVFNSFNLNVVEMLRARQIVANSTVALDLRVFEATIEDIIV